MQFNLRIPLWLYDVFVIRMYAHGYRWARKFNAGEHSFSVGYTRLILTPRPGTKQVDE